MIAKINMTGIDANADSIEIIISVFDMPSSPNSIVSSEKIQFRVKQNI